MAAITHIDNCEKDKENGEQGKVWKVNVDASFEIAKYCEEKNKRMIYLSTECVFDGSQKYYSERAKKNPKNWYGFTKSKAEDKIISTKAKVAIIRSVVAYHISDRGKTIYGKFVAKLRSGNTVYAVTDQKFTPTFTNDIVDVIIRVIENRLSGIFHVAPRKSITPYEFALLVAKRNKFPTSRVKKTTLRKLYGPERAKLRLRNASLSSVNSNKILKFTAVAPSEII
jgi:dTDP-4-dehydrorhamnose reductase